MGMWANHRARQAGKFQKRAAVQMQQLVHHQQSQVQHQAQVQHQMVQSQTQATGQAWRAGYSKGFADAWRAGQNDLIDALRTGRVRWEDLQLTPPGHTASSGSVTRDQLNAQLSPSVSPAPPASPPVGRTADGAPSGRPGAVGHGVSTAGPTPR